MSWQVEGKRIYVAGDRGMVGQAMLRRLEREDCEVLTAPKSLDLREQADTRSWLAEHAPDAIVVAAARVGGILANDTRPAEFLHDNIAIATNLIEGAHRTGTNRLLFLGSSCIYPRLAPQPIPEDALLTGPLEPTNEWYAIAKIAGVKLCDAYRVQHGRDYISAMPTNLYGPGDNYDPAGSHVLPALVRKAHEARHAGARQLVVWGSGEPRREFLHVDDLADALVFLLQEYSGRGPINVGSGQEVSIAQLAQLVCDIVGYDGEIVFDASKPDGSPRKLLDTSRLTEMGWTARTGLEDGIADAYAAYLAGNGRFIS